MQPQSNPEAANRILIPLTAQEYELAMNILFMAVNPASDDLLLHVDYHSVANLYNKFSFLSPNKTGDACRHPVQSPVAVGQGGTISVPISISDLWQTLKNPDYRPKHLRLSSREEEQGSAL